MKKVIAFILVTLMATMLLTGCNSNEVNEIQQEVAKLQSELSQVKEQIPETQSTTPDVELPETSETQPAEEKLSETTTKTVTSDMLDYLTTQLKSDNYEDWDSVATCNYATEKHLLTAAKQCAAIPGDFSREDWAQKIATSICNNPAATGKVIKELSNSTWYPVWNIAAQSTYADEEALIAIAKECAAIPDDLSRKAWAQKIATSICNNPAATGKVIKELSNSTWYPVWNIAAQSTYADEEALIAIAKECAAIPDDSSRKAWAQKIATSICDNPAATGKVIKELSNSTWYPVWNIAAQSTYADEEALIAIAKECAAIPGDSSRKAWAQKIATSICDNPAVTDKVLKKLASSNFTTVTATAHAKLEEALSQ